MTPVTTISSGYLDLLDVWARQIGPIISVKPHVVCMDTRAAQTLTNSTALVATLADSHLLNATSRRAYWVRRLAVLRQIFDHQGSFLHSDADAFWLRDPSHLLGLGDLVVSTEQGLPKDIVRRRGFVVCCGFIAMHKTPATTAFFDKWQTECVRRNDDQIAINRLLDRAVGTWRPLEIEGTTSHVAEVDFGGGPFRVIALSSELVCREQAFDVGQKTYVAHPFFERRFHAAYVALYDQLVTRGALHQHTVGPGPRHMKRRRWATYLQYKQLGDDIPAQCLVHAAHLAIEAGDYTDALHRFDRAGEVTGDALVDLFDLQSRLGLTEKANQTLGAIASDKAISDGQLGKLFVASVSRLHPSALRLATRAVGRIGHPARAHAALRRLYLRATGAI